MRYAFGSQLAILQNCPLVISRILRKGRSLLLAAKILVISRLLHKTLSQAKDAPPILETIRNRLASIRRRLLSQVDRQFSNPNANLAALLEAMCALSLATSSTSTDVLRHFHHVRLEAVTSQLERADEERSSTIEALQLYVRTLQDTHAIFPKRLPDSLARLKEQPIIMDPEVKSVAELNLDIHERWIAEDVRNFTPWVRHDDLQKGVADKLLKEWAALAFKKFVAGFTDILATVGGFDKIIQLRRQVLEMWLSSRNRIPKSLISEGLEGLRLALNAKLIDVVHDFTSHFQVVGTEIAAAVRQDRPNTTFRSLWDSSMTSMDISDGATDFRQAILDRIHGRNESSQRVIGSYEKCLQFVVESERVIKELREAQWVDDLEDDGEDDFELDSKYPELIEDDPRALEEELDKSLAQGFAMLEREVQKLAHDVKLTQEGQQAIFLLRILREIRRRLPKRGNTEGFALSAIPELHATVAVSVSTQPLRSFEQAAKRHYRRAPARALWEGIPQLPVQPSPTIFGLLKDLVTSMVDCGADIWSPAGTQALKTTVKQQLSESPSKYLEPKMVNGDHADLEENTTSKDIANGLSSLEENDAPKPESTASEDWKIQKVFDVLFLQLALTIPPTGDGPDGLTILENALVDDLELDDSLHERLRKSSQEYWKRMYLLFGLLA